VDLAQDARVLGDHTLSASALTLSDQPADLARKLTRYPQLPCTLAGRPAADQATGGWGLGQDLPVDALNRGRTDVEQITAIAVAVASGEQATVDFYRHHGSLPLQTQPRCLFVPMRRVPQLPR
jgi:hypothetical protein